MSCWWFCGFNLLLLLMLSDLWIIDSYSNPLQSYYPHRNLFQKCQKERSWKQQQLHQHEDHHHEDERFQFDSSFNDFQDISPKKDGGILKKLISRGNGMKGYPQTGDLVLVDWVFYDENQTMIHDSIDLDETFYFTLGVKYQVIDAFDIAVRTMYEGETAFLKILPEYGFGAYGGEGLFQPNQTLFLEFTLEELVIGLRQYESITDDFDIKKELREKIEMGEIDPDEIPEALLNELPSKQEEKKKEEEKWDGIPVEAKIPAAPIPLTSQEPTRISNNKALETRSEPSSSSSQKITDIPDSPERKNKRFFDPEKNKLDPNRTIRGVGEGHVWDETVDQIIVEVEIPEDLEKKDLNIEISSHSLYVMSLKGDYEFGGELFGRINPSETSWVIDGDDPTSEIRGKRLIFNFQKAATSQDLWGSFFNRKTLEQKR